MIDGHDYQPVFFNKDLHLPIDYVFTEKIK